MTVVTVLEGELLTDQPSITGTAFGIAGGYVPVHSGTRIYKMTKDDFVGLLNPLQHVVELYYPTTGQVIIPVSGYYPGTGQLSVFSSVIGTRFGEKLVTGVDYTEETTTTFSLIVPAAANTILELVIGDTYSITLAATSKTSQDIVATAGQTVLVTDTTYVPGLNQIELYRNGALQGSHSYEETNGNAITVVNPAIFGTEFRIIYNQVSTVLIPDPAGMRLTDGVTAPTAVSGLAIVYVDIADGNLKVKFEDGVVQTIGIDKTAFTVFANADTTPSVLGLKNFTTPATGPVTYTAFDDGTAGQEILVKVGAGAAVFDFTGTTLKGNAGVNWTAADGDFLRATFDGTNWLVQITDVTA